MLPILFSRKLSKQSELPSEQIKFWKASDLPFLTQTCLNNLSELNLERGRTSTEVISSQPVPISHLAVVMPVKIKKCLFWGRSETRRSGDWTSSKIRSNGFEAQRKAFFTR